MTNGSDTYRTLFDLYLSGYQATSTSLRSKSENETIDSALSTFGGLTDKTDEEIARLTASEDKGDTAAAEDMTTILEAGFLNIKDIFAKAVEWDAAHVKAASTTSQANVEKLANDQEATDQELVANLDGLISKAREALLRAAGSEPKTEPQPGTGPEDEVETDLKTDSEEPPEEPDDQDLQPGDADLEVATEEAARTGKMNEQLVAEDKRLSGAAAPDDEIPETAGPEDPSKDDED